MNLSAITEYYGSTSPYGKNDVAQQRFLGDLVLYIAKYYIALFVVENSWLWRLVLRRDSKIKFPTRK